MEGLQVHHWYGKIQGWNQVFIGGVAREAICHKWKRQKKNLNELARFSTAL
jgi:hypothetical protein